MVKNPPANAGDPGLIPGLGRSPGEGNGNTLQYSCLGNPMDRGVWLATAHVVTKESHALLTKTHKTHRTLYILQLTFSSIIFFYTLSTCKHVALGHSFSQLHSISLYDCI